MLEFGITFKPDMPHQRMIALTKQAEAAGFDYGWIFDSHVLWQEAYPLMTLMAVNTERMRLGTCVTNPAVRDATVTASLLATLNRISGGRMDLGIGRGDSSRRVMGKKPTTLERLEETVRVIRDLCCGASRLSTRAATFRCRGPIRVCRRSGSRATDRRRCAAPAESATA